MGMSAQIEKGAPGAVFSMVGILLCGIAWLVSFAVYYVQHAMLVYGPVIRNWLLAHPMHIAAAAFGALFVIAVWGLSELDS
jgi:hypothetical protein